MSDERRVRVEKIGTYSDHLPHEAMPERLGNATEKLFRVKTRVTNTGQLYVEVNVRICVKDVDKFREGINVEFYYEGKTYENGIGRDTWTNHLSKCEACQARSSGPANNNDDDITNWLSGVAS